VTLKEPVEGEIAFPKEWYLGQQQGRTVHFVDSQYADGDGRIREMFPNCTNVEMSGMSLREIFVVFAKKFMITEL
jgi:hypothetical protein